MKFLHAADLHLDSPLRGLERYDGAPVEQLRTAPRTALQNLIALAISEQVAFVLIAGDVFDGDWPDYNTGLYFASQMTRLHEAGIPVFLISGNHDAASQITRKLTLPENVRTFGSTKPETFELRELGVAIHGQSFATQAVTEDLSADYPAARSGMFNIGLLHTSAGGREGHENYAPCSVAGLVAKGYAYWALGHVHQREILHRDPWVVFPGNIQGRHVRETGSKGCTIVTVEDGRVVDVVHETLDVVRWCECEVSADGADDQAELLDRVRSALRNAADQADGRLLAARVIVRGTCRAHGHVMKHGEQFVADCRAMANDLGAGRVWVEKIKLATRAEVDLDELARGSDPIAQLLQFCRHLPNDPAALTDMLGEFKDLNQKLPLELRQGTDAIRLDDPAYLRDLLPEIEQLLVPRLLEQDAAP
jgi:hypothetical protein